MDYCHLDVIFDRYRYQRWSVKEKGPSKTALGLSHSRALLATKPTIISIQELSEAVFQAARLLSRR
jgi:hypothetical protein